MRDRPRRPSSNLAAAVATLALVCLPGPPTAAEAPRPVSAEQLATWMRELSNWGRWGASDQLGTINLITPEKRLEALRLAREGVSVSLAHETLTTASPDNGNPYEHTMLVTGSGGRGSFAVDRLGVLFHGYAHTHLDALCHMWQGDTMYNGFRREEVDDDGCDTLSILAFKDGILTRGVLIDIPRLRGIDYLEPGTPVYAEDLDAWEKHAGLRISSGDAVFLRTGRWSRRDAVGPWNVAEQSAGLHASAVAWLAERDVALLGSDVASDVFPSGVEGNTHPVHQLVLVALGMPIFDNCDLEDVARAAASRGRWEFLLTAAPLPIPGGTGSPLNPIATF